MEVNLSWKMTVNGKQPLMEENKKEQQQEPSPKFIILQTNKGQRPKLVN